MTFRLWDRQGVLQVSWAVAKPEKRRQFSTACTPEQKAANQKRATMRACAQIRRDLLTIGADRMLTLTYRENMTDRARAIGDLIRFNKAMRVRFGSWASVAVLEFQQRGAAHFHLGIAGFYPVEVVRAVWLSVVGSGNGNIDISFKPDGRGNQYSKLATYMGKYLAKDLDEGRKEGDHRYFRCHIDAHPKEVYYIPATCEAGIERQIALEVIEATLGTHPNGCSVWVAPSIHGSSGYAMAERTSYV